MVTALVVVVAELVEATRVLGVCACISGAVELINPQPVSVDAIAALKITTLAAVAAFPFCLAAGLGAAVGVGGRGAGFGLFGMLAFIMLLCNSLTGLPVLSGQTCWFLFYRDARVRAAG